MPSLPPVNAIGALNVFDLVKEKFPNVKLYQASSSEMFDHLSMKINSREKQHQ